MEQIEVTKPRGVLNPKMAGKKFQLSRPLPSEDLAFFIEYYWIVNWDLRGQEPYLQEVLPHPCVHLTFERNNTRIVGVMRTKFTQLLEGKGGVFGIRFKPGAFYPFVKTPVAKFTDVSVRVKDVFGIETQPIEDAILTVEDESKQIALAEDFLRQILPEQDDNVTLISQMVAEIIADREITKLDQLGTRFHMSNRTIQRLFSQYVGIAPKWVIKRARLHEAAQQLDNGEVVDWTNLALNLGYFDQSHFIKDFKAMVGKTPSEYARSQEV